MTPARTAAAAAYCAAGGITATLAGARAAAAFHGSSAWTAWLLVSAALTVFFAALATRWNPRPQPHDEDTPPALPPEERDFRESLALGFTEDLDAFTRRLDEATRKDT